MKRIHTTNLLLGVIAAEVVFLAAHAIANRQPAADRPFRAELPEPENSRGHSSTRSVSGALARVAQSLRRWFIGTDGESARGAGRPRDRREHDDADIRGRNRLATSPSNDRLRHAGPESDQNDGASLQGNMQGIAEKLKDPAWSGALAANDGNISLTDAERAVPMPRSARFVERLDRNPFIGGGMKDHSRDHI